MLVSALLLGPAFASAAPNWTARYPTCKQHEQLLKAGPLDIGVRILTSNALLATEFQRALDYWGTVLDLRWHGDQSENCAVELVDGKPDLFISLDKCNCISARSQNPDEPGFEGWIAFNPGAQLTDAELFRMSVHEIGHLLGLGHSANTGSVMYFLDLDSPVALVGDDLRALATRHKLRRPL